MIQNKEVFTTADGSKTFYLPELNEYYHSHHGAIREAKHVFLKNGLYQKTEEEISILEIGFGTGLNAFLTLIESQKTSQTVHYTGIEAFPLTTVEANELAYTNNQGYENLDELFSELHAVGWGDFSEITNQFYLKKVKGKIQEMEFNSSEFDLIYFDAFGPRVQSEMWIIEVFRKLFEVLKVDGILVTYCAKGQVKRDLKTVGFEVETLPGPPGKREMVRAQKRS